MQRVICLAAACLDDRDCTTRFILSSNANCSMSRTVKILAEPRWTEMYSSLIPQVRRRAAACPRRVNRRAAVSLWAFPLNVCEHGSIRHKRIAIHNKWL